jgi:predicted AlkP superfamily phosphohydrolase/phosphomutase
MHTAGHLFWHSSQAHPLAAQLSSRPDGDYLLDVLEAIDRGLGSLIEKVDAGADIVVFSPHGMQANSLDLYSMLFLPEILHRWTSGKAAFPNNVDRELEAPKSEFSRHWREEVWDMRTEHGDAVLESPELQASRGDPLDWDPANWYQRLWPTMKAFVLPGYSEGLIRINVADRDGPGGIPAEQFDAVCTELTDLLGQLTDARSGERMVEKVLRVRATPGETEASRSPADLIVVWRDDLCTDAVTHPTLGRIGPVPFFRSGGHSTEGFFLAKGAGIAAGARLPVISTADVTATLLDRLGQDIPDYVAGKPCLGAAKH